MKTHTKPNRTNNILERKRRKSVGQSKIWVEIIFLCIENAQYPFYFLFVTVYIAPNMFILAMFILGVFCLLFHKLIFLFSTINVCFCEWIHYHIQHNTWKIVWGFWATFIISIPLFGKWHIFQWTRKKTFETFMIYG